MSSPIGVPGPTRVSESLSSFESIANSSVFPSRLLFCRTLSSGLPCRRLIVARRERDCKFTPAVKLPRAKAKGPPRGGPFHFHFARKRETYSAGVGKAACSG